MGSEANGKYGDLMLGNDTNEFSRGVLAPADGNAGSQANSLSLEPADEAATEANGVNLQDLGANLERLEEARPDLVNSLRELVRQYRMEGIAARRHEIRRIRQARLFWQGLQYAWWNANDMNWHLPYENPTTDNRELEEMPRYQFVTNFYQGFGLSFVAVLSQDVPSVRFYPQSFQSLVDIAAARAASDVAELIERNNHVEDLLTAIGYFLWTDGKLGAYVRYVEDAQRFGYRDVEILEAIEVPLGPDVWKCPECGKEAASGEWRAASEEDSSVGPMDFKAESGSGSAAADGKSPFTSGGTQDTDQAFQPGMAVPPICQGAAPNLRKGT